MTSVMMDLKKTSTYPVCRIDLVDNFGPVMSIINSYILNQFLTRNEVGSMHGDTKKRPYWLLRSEIYYW